MREKRKVSLKQPIMSLTIINSDPQFHQSLKEYIPYLEEEINTPTIIHETEVAKYIDLKAVPNHKVLGSKLQKAYNKDLKAAASALTAEQINELQSTGKITLLDQTLELGDFVIEKKYKKEFSSEHLELGGDGDFILLLDLSQDEKLKNKGLLRDLTSNIQKTKKKTGLKVEDDVVIFFDATKAPVLAAAIAADLETLQKTLKRPFKPLTEKAEGLVTVPESNVTLTIEGETVQLEICYNK